MRQNIRLNTFETNSSSVHSMVILSNETYDKFKKEELYFHPMTEKFITREEIPELADFKQEYPDHITQDDVQREINIRDFLKDFCNEEYACLYTNNWLDTCVVNAFDKDGKEIVVLSYYIGDC